MTKAKLLPCIELLNELFAYDRELGKLYWKVNNQEAGSIDSKGHVQVTLIQGMFKAHRIIWKMHTGEEPPYEIDHENLKGNDNRFDNLRQATHSQNLANAKKYNTNTSGVKGVSWHKGRKKWQAFIKLAFKLKHLGYFDSFDEAVKVRQAAAIETFGEFARL